MTPDLITSIATLLAVLAAILNQNRSEDRLNKRIDDVHKRFDDLKELFRAEMRELRTDLKAEIREAGSRRLIG